MNSVNRRNRKQKYPTEKPKIRFDKYDNFSDIFAVKSPNSPPSSYDPEKTNHLQGAGKIKRLDSRTLTRSSTHGTDYKPYRTFSFSAATRGTADTHGVAEESSQASLTYENQRFGVSGSVGSSFDYGSMMGPTRGFFSRLFSKNRGSSFMTVQDLTSARRGQLSQMHNLSHRDSGSVETSNRSNARVLSSRFGLLKTASQKLRSTMPRPRKNKVAEVSVNRFGQNDTQLTLNPDGDGAFPRELDDSSFNSRAISPNRTLVDITRSPSRLLPSVSNTIQRNPLKRVFSSVARDRKNFVFQKEKPFQAVNASQLFSRSTAVIDTQDLHFTSSGVERRTGMQEMALDMDVQDEAALRQTSEAFSLDTAASRSENSRLGRRANRSSIEDERRNMKNQITGRGKYTIVSDTTSVGSKRGKTQNDQNERASIAETFSLSDKESDFDSVVEGEFHDFINNNAADLVSYGVDGSFVDDDHRLHDDISLDGLSSIFPEEEDARNDSGLHGTDLISGTGAFTDGFDSVVAGTPIPTGTMYPLGRQIATSSFVTTASNQTTQMIFQRTKKGKKFKLKKNTKQPIKKALSKEALEKRAQARLAAAIHHNSVDNSTNQRDTFASVVFDTQGRSDSGKGAGISQQKLKNTSMESEIEEEPEQCSESDILEVLDALNIKDGGRTLKKVKGILEKKQALINSFAKMVKNPEKYYEVKEIIGTGTFGEVRCCRELSSYQLHAVKICELRTVQNILDCAKELELLQGIKGSPYVITFLKALQTKRQELWISTDFCEVGDLNALMDICKITLQEREIKVVLSCVVLGLCHLHENMILHRDLKASNILLASNGLTKIADFGVSRKVKDHNQRAMTFVGSPYWMAPEVIRDDHVYNHKADIYSLGILVLELLKGNPPFIAYEQQEAMQKILDDSSEDELYDGISNISYHLENLLDDLLEREIDSRPSAAQIIDAEYPFLDETIKDLQFLHRNHFFEGGNPSEMDTQVVRIGNYDSTSDRLMEKAIYRSIQPMRDLADKHLPTVTDYRETHNRGFKRWIKRGKNV
eukprot:augustus_masked-scaffold_15-processed-gene-1.47-mRNA-1 protein AED:0.41 eAED:0.41 QI:0/-1/0/1/-1/1/1/0/1042